MADNTDFFVSIAQQALWITALAAAPFLIPALLTGLLLGMVQAATSINEQTLSFVPKLVVIAVVAATFGGTVLVLIADFTREIYARIPELLL
jgi:flagellar biosynthetic protein FliQ